MMYVFSNYININYIYIFIINLQDENLINPTSKDKRYNVMYYSNAILSYGCT